MSNGLGNHIRNNVVGYIAIFLFAIGGTAYATHPGGANTIDSGDIIDGQVANADLGSDAVSTAKIIDAGVRSQDVRDDNLVNGGLNAQDLNPDSVGTSEVDGSLTAANIVDGAGSGLDADVLDGVQASGFVADADNAGGDLTGPFSNLQIGSGRVDANEIATDGVGSFEIATDAVSINEVATNAIRADEIAADAVGQSEIGDDQVRSAEIANSVVGSSEIAGAAVGLTELGGFGGFGSQANPPNLQAGACVGVLATITTGSVDAGELLLAAPQTDMGAGIYVVPTFVGHDGERVIRVCNASGSAVDPPATNFLVRLLG